MKRGLLYSCRATTGREGKYVSRHMCIIQEQCGIIDHLNSNSSQHTKQNIEKYSLLTLNRSVNMYGDFYESVGMNMSSWEEVYNSIDVSPLRQYDYLYLIAGIDLHSSNMTRFGNRVGVFPKDNKQMTWLSHAKVYLNVLALLKAHRTFGIPLHEFQYDTGEISCRLFHEEYRPYPELYASYYNHDVPEYDIVRIDSLQYYLQKSKVNPLFVADKTIDFTFAYTVLKTSKRQDFPVFVNGVANMFPVSKVFTKNYFTGVDTSIDSDLYTDIVSRSRFTMILPAYDRKSYAIDRLLTALSLDCLPLIHHEANNSVVESSYNISLQPLTITDPGDVTRFTESVRLELLEYYKSKLLSVERKFIDFV